jgi:uncharacterized membrane protein
MKTLIILLAIYLVIDLIYTIHQIIQLRKLKNLLKKLQSDLLN